MGGCSADSGHDWKVWEMSVEERIRFLLRTARRIEQEGDSRVASLFRQMASDALQAARPVPGLVIGRSEG